MKKVFFAVLIFPFLIFAEESFELTSAEEVPVPSFINLETVDLSQTPEKHEVVTGDTLWDISSTYLKSPWYWPKVWSLNPQIANPHLIYPGDILPFRYSGQILLPQGEQSGTTAGGVVDEGESDQLARTGKTLDATPEHFKEYVKLGGKFRIDRFKHIDDTIFDVSKKGFIAIGEYEDLGKIVGAYEPKELLSTEDNVYVKLGKVTFNVGEYVEFIHIKNEIDHPKTGKNVGNIIEVVGRGKVLDVNSDRIATVKIVKAFDSIDRGYSVREYIKTDSNVKIVDNSADVKTTIITGYDPTFFYGTSYVIYLDKGSDDGVDKGALFSVYRRGDGLDELDSDVEVEQLPYEIVGELVVIRVLEKTSVAVITKSLTGLVAGDIAVSGVIE